MNEHEVPAFARAIYDRLFPEAAAIIKEGQQHAAILATFRVVNGTPVPLAFTLLGIEDPGERGKVLRQLAADCDQQTCYCYIDEGWMVLEPAAIAAIIAGTAPTPIDHPLRIETVSFVIYGRDWEACAYCEIKRPSNELEKGPLQRGRSAGRMSPTGRNTVEP